MSQNIVYPNGYATVTLTASQKIAVATEGTARVDQVVGYPNHPNTQSNLTTVNNGVYTSSAFTSGGTVIVYAGAAPVYYEVGLSPSVDASMQHQYQGAPTALDATGTLTAAAIIGGLVTSSTAAAVTATLDTGAIMDTASQFAIGDSFDWSAINTGAANAFTVTASTGHTIVGAGAVAASSSGHFRTRKTAASTFVTYRLS